MEKSKEEIREEQIEDILRKVNEMPEEEYFEFVRNLEQELEEIKAEILNVQGDVKGLKENPRKRSLSKKVSNGIVGGFGVATAVVGTGLLCNQINPIEIIDLLIVSANSFMSYYVGACMGAMATIGYENKVISNKINDFKLHLAKKKLNDLLCKGEFDLDTLFAIRYRGLKDGFDEMLYGKRNYVSQQNESSVMGE